MRVRELMTEQVLTIGPEAPIKDVAKVLVDHGISGLPVCDIECRVLGVISEGDILYKEHDPREGHIGGPLRWIIDGTPNYSGYVKADALTAGKAMTTPAITIPPYESVSEAARIMCELGVNRLPVVKDERLVGIITRADLVRAFTRSDEDIAREIREDVFERDHVDRHGQGRGRRAARSRSTDRPTQHEERRRAPHQIGAPRSRRDRGRVAGHLERRRQHAQGPAIPGGAHPMNLPAHAFAIEQVRQRLEAGNGGYEVVHSSPGLEVGVYVLVAPEPDKQQPHADDEVYVVLEGSGVLNVEGEAIPVSQGQAIFVPAGADHQFTAYEGLSVLVIFARDLANAVGATRAAP